jgi:peptidylprolyl isomerase
VTQQTSRPRRPGNRPPTRAEKRKQWRAEAARAAAVRRKRNAIFGAVGSVLVVVLLGALVFWVVNREDSGDGTGSGTGVQGPNASTTAGAGFPQLPEGADAALGTKPTVTGGCTGITELTPTTLIKGTGPAAQAGQQITVNYVGVSCATGDEFDASWKRSQPFDFQLGQGGVIEGWDKGLVGVTVGSRVQLDIPSKMAYGDDASSGRPTGPLRFVVDVLKVG